MMYSCQPINEWKFYIRTTCKQNWKQIRKQPIVTDKNNIWDDEKKLIHIIKADSITA